MNKEKFGFSTLSRLLGKKNKDKNNTKSNDNASQNAVINNKGNYQQQQQQQPQPMQQQPPLQQQQIQQQIQQQSQQQQPQVNHSILHNNTISPLPAATTNAPFEQTFRITVLLPREQLYVARLGARAKLKQLMQLVSENKLLNGDQYEFRDPIDSSQVFDLESTIGTVGLSEIRLCHKSEQKYNNHFNSDDIVKLRSQTSVAGRLSVTSSELSSKHSMKIIPKTSPYSSTNSLNSMDSTGMHANYTTPISIPPSAASTTTISTVATTGQIKPPVAPARKKRLAPRPPSQISVPEKEALPSITDWKRPNQKVNGDSQQLTFDNTNSEFGLQRKEFSSSTPNLNSNGNGTAHLAIYGEIDLHESSTSIDCNGNNQTSQKNYNHKEENGNIEGDWERKRKEERNIHNRSISVQYENGYSKPYFGSVQNFAATPNAEGYDSGSYLSLDQYTPDNHQKPRGFPQPSPRKITNIKKKTAAPPPPLPRSIAPKPVATPRETVVNADHENTHNSVSEDSTKHEAKSPTNMIINGNHLIDKFSSPAASDLVSYDGSQTSEISTENGQSSRTASTLSMTSQSTSILEEQYANRRSSVREVEVVAKSPPKETANFSNSTTESTIKSLQEDDDSVVDEAILMCIPAPPRFADGSEHILEENLSKSPEVPKVQITIKKPIINEIQYKDETDLVTEAFKDIEDMPDETTEMTEEYKMEENVEVVIQAPSNGAVKEDIVIINSDIEDGYQGNKVTASTVESESKADINKCGIRINEKCDFRKDNTDQPGKKSIGVKTPEVLEVVQNNNINTLTNFKHQVIDTKPRVPLVQVSNDMNNAPKSNSNLKTQTSTIQLQTSAPATLITEETPIKPKTNDRLYENRVTVKLSNSIKFRKSIGRSDSFHATQHYQNNEFKHSNSEDDSDSRSLSFLSLLAAQREEIRSSQNSLDIDRRKLENRKSTSDLTIGELPNLQSLIVMKSILNSQNNLNKISQNDVSNLNNDSDVREFSTDRKKSDGGQKKTGDMEIKSEEIPKISSILRMKNDDNEEVKENKLNQGEDFDDGNVKKWTYQGRPNISLSTWSERPKHTNDVTIKNEGDYIFGGATVKRTSSISSLQRNRMSLPAVTPVTANIHITNYPSDQKRQSIVDVKLRKVTEEPISHMSNHSNNNNEYPDFRSTLRKSEHSAKLYSPVENTITSGYHGAEKTQQNNLNENLDKSFVEKTKSFGPIINRRTTGYKETLILGQKSNREEKAPSIVNINNNQHTINDGCRSPIETIRKSSQSEFIMPVKMHINEKALYDNTNDINSNHRNSMPLIRPIIIKQNMSLNLTKKPTIINTLSNYNTTTTSINTGGSAPITKAIAITPTTPINTQQVEGDPKTNFLSEIQKFDKKNLKRV